MKIKLMLTVFIAFFILGITVYCHAEDKEREIDGLYITKPEVVILNSPVTVTNKMTLDDIKPVDRLLFVETRIKRYECKTWNEVLTLHTSNSIKQLDELEGKKYFEEHKKNKDPQEYGFSFVSYVSCKQNGDDIIITQSVPWELKDADYNSYSFFMLSGYRKVGNQWKIDGTLLSSKLAAIIVSTPPVKLQETIDNWWEDLESEE